LKLKEIEALDRFREVPREGPFCDLLWSDPVDVGNDDEPMDDESYNWFSHNDTRQCSFVFGVDAVSTFLQKNHLTAIIRAHEVQYNGYKMHFVNEQTQIPRVITIFSAPNYCDVYKNKGACLKFDNELLNIRQFVCSPHPYYLPNFMDVFSWSLPFVAEKVTDMLWQVLKHGEEENKAASTSSSNNKQIGSVSVTNQTNVMNQKGSVLREKVIAVTKMMNMYKTLRQEQESIVKLKQLSPNKKLPHGILSQGPGAIQQIITTFANAKHADRLNEARPGQDGAPPAKKEKAETPRRVTKFREKKENNAKNGAQAVNK
jgi:serine/threonine-protein phosphatase 2B catalytic subunit